MHMKDIFKLVEDAGLEARNPLVLIDCEEQLIYNKLRLARASVRELYRDFSFAKRAEITEGLTSVEEALAVLQNWAKGKACFCKLPFSVC